MLYFPGFAGHKALTFQIKRSIVYQNMISIESQIKSLNEIYRKVMHFCSPAYYREYFLDALMGYLDLLESDPYIKIWFDEKKAEWVASGKDQNLINPWPLYYDYLSSIYNFYIKQEGTLPKLLETDGSDGDDPYKVSQLHNAVTTLLLKRQIQSSEGPVNYGIDFNEQTGVLSVGKHLIKFRSKQRNSHSVLILNKLKSLGWRVSYEDLIDQLGVENNKNPWLACYTACKNIKNAVSEQTKGQVSDFISFGANPDGYVEVNNKYIHI